MLLIGIGKGRKVVLLVFSRVGDLGYWGVSGNRVWWGYLFRVGGGCFGEEVWVGGGGRGVLKVGVSIGRSWLGKFCVGLG